MDTRPRAPRPRALAYAVFDGDLRCSHADSTYAHLVRASEPDAVVGRSFRDVNPGLSISECRRVALLLGARSARSRQVHLHLRPAEGGGVRLWQFGYTRARVSSAAGLAVGGLDVTAQAGRLLDQRAGDDLLGGLSDAMGFRIALQDAIRKHRDGGRRPGVLLVDVAPALDVVWAEPEIRRLVELAVSRRLRSSLREGDLVTRIDGGRFAVLCGDAAEAFPVADRVRESLTRLLVLGAGTDVPGPRMGTAAAIPGEPAERLLSRARGVLDAASAAGVDSAAVMAVSQAGSVVDLRERPRSYADEPMPTPTPTLRPAARGR